jgi:hypothetical protein
VVSAFFRVSMDFAEILERGSVRGVVDGRTIGGDERRSGEEQGGEEAHGSRARG